MKAEPLDIHYDEASDTVKIAGITYAGELFRQFGGLFAIGTRLRIVERENGVITFVEEADER